MTRLAIALLLLAATAGVAEVVVIEAKPVERLPNLWGLRTIEINGRDDHNVELRDALARLPGIIVTREATDIAIDYEETRTWRGTTWTAKIFQLKCQDDCANRVYVRIKLAEMGGKVEKGERAVDVFARKLLEALLTSAPPPLAPPNP